MVLLIFPSIVPVRMVQPEHNLKLVMKASTCKSMHLTDSYYFYSDENIIAIPATRHGRAKSCNTSSVSLLNMTFAGTEPLVALLTARSYMQRYIPAMCSWTKLKEQFNIIVPYGPSTRELNFVNWDAEPITAYAVPQSVALEKKIAEFPCLQSLSEGIESGEAPNERRSEVR